MSHDRPGRRRSSRPFLTEHLTGDRAEDIAATSQPKATGTAIAGGIVRCPTPPAQETHHSEPGEPRG